MYGTRQAFPPASYPFLDVPFVSLNFQSDILLVSCLEGLEMSSPESSSADLSSDSARTNVADRVFGVGFFVGFSAIIFFGGMLAAIGEVPPYQTVRNAWIAFGALVAQNDLLSAKFPNYLWMPTDRTDRGLVQCDSSQAEAGYTLYTSAHDCVAMLLNMEGKEVHRWTAPFRQTWPHAKHFTILGAR